MDCRSKRCIVTSWDAVAANLLLQDRQTPKPELHWLRSGRTDFDPLGDIRGKRVVDLGCGDGKTSAEMALRGAFVLGVDSSPTQIHRCRGSYGGLSNCEFVISDASSDTRTLGMSGPFDIATSLFGAMQYGSPTAVLSNTRRLLSTEGRLVFSVRSPISDGVGDGELPHIRSIDGLLPDGSEVRLAIWHCGRSVWRDILGQAGFSILRMEEIDGTLVVEALNNQRGT